MVRQWETYDKALIRWGYALRLPVCPQGVFTQTEFAPPFAR